MSLPVELQAVLQKYGLPKLMGLTPKQLTEAVLLFLRNTALQQYGVKEAARE